MLSLTFCAVGLSAFAQQQAMFTQYMFNQLALNPAYAGIHEGISASALIRDQWVGLEGAPATQTFSVHSPLNYRPVSLGALFIHDKIGVTDQVGAYLSYAYRIAVSRKSRISFGIQGCLTNYRTDYDGEGTNDPTLSGSDVHIIQPNVGAGIMWHGEKFYLGISSPQLINQEFDRNNPDSDAKLVRHYFLLAGYVFDISPSVKLKPNILVKRVQGAPPQVDLNCNVLLRNLIWVGMSYRSLDSFDALLQIQLTRQLQLGYAFDFATTTELSRVNSGSHEIMLNYIFNLPKTKTLTPRYF